MSVTTEHIWETFHTPLYQFILKHINDATYAEDILQDVFLKIHMRIGSLKEEEKLKHWLYQIARNAIYDYYRQHKVTEMLSEDYDIPEEMTEEDAERELLPCVTEMVNSLPDNYRQALLLTEYQGFTQRELGERLGLSFSGAKSRVQRAREKLKLMLLECCHFEFDRRGKIIDYYPNCTCCSGPTCNTSCGT
ncbi:MAG: RNA polymerase sigma factor SigZ [Chloroflexota bacterium]|nr:RNA polymerase sigma factor SigZ [Chloroflexota bacterium]